MSDDRLRAAVRSESELAMTEAAFEGLRIAMVNELIATNYDQADARERLYHALRGLEDVRDTLKKAVKFGTDQRAYEEAAAQLAKGRQV